MKEAACSRTCAEQALFSFLLYSPPNAALLALGYCILQPQNGSPNSILAQSIIPTMILARLAPAGAFSVLHQHQLMLCHGKTTQKREQYSNRGKKKLKRHKSLASHECVLQSSKQLMLFLRRSLISQYSLLNILIAQNSSHSRRDRSDQVRSQPCIETPPSFF